MPIDLICFLVFGICFWIGYNRGIIELAFNLLAYVFGVILAFKMTPLMASVLGNFFQSDNPLMFIAGFLVNVALVMVVVRLAANGMEGIFELAYMGMFNKLLGGAVYSALGVLLFSVLVWFADKAMMVSDETKRLSKTYETLVRLPIHAKDAVIRVQPVFAEIWDTSMSWMDKLENYRPNQTEQKDEPKFYDIKDDASSKGSIEAYPETQKPARKPAKPADDTPAIEND